MLISSQQAYSTLKRDIRIENDASFFLIGIGAILRLGLLLIILIKRQIQSYYYYIYRISYNLSTLGSLAYLSARFYLELTISLASILAIYNTKQRTASETLGGASVSYKRGSQGTYLLSFFLLQNCQFSGDTYIFYINTTIIALYLRRYLNLYIVFTLYPTYRIDYGLYRRLRISLYVVEYPFVLSRDQSLPAQPNNDPFDPLNTYPSAANYTIQNQLYRSPRPYAT